MYESLILLVYSIKSNLFRRPKHKLSLSICMYKQNSMYVPMLCDCTQQKNSIGNVIVIGIQQCIPSYSNIAIIFTYELRKFICWCWRHHIYMAWGELTVWWTMLQQHLSNPSFTSKETNIFLLQHLSPMYCIKAASVKTENMEKKRVEVVSNSEKHDHKTKFLKETKNKY